MNWNNWNTPTKSPVKGATQIWKAYVQEIQMYTGNSDIVYHCERGIYIVRDKEAAERGEERFMLKTSEPSKIPVPPTSFPSLEAAKRALQAIADVYGLQPRYPYYTRSKSGKVKVSDYRKAFSLFIREGYNDLENIPGEPVDEDAWATLEQRWADSNYGYPHILDRKLEVT